MNDHKTASGSINIFREVAAADIAADYNLSTPTSIDSANATFELHDRLTGRRNAADFDADQHSSKLHVGDILVHIMNPTVPDSEWQEVGLPGLRISRVSPSTRANLIGALGLVAAEPSAGRLFSAYVRNLFYVEQETPDARLITSCSIPDFPFSVFLSERAFHHIPPTSFSREPSLYLGAENLYHEAVHQAVSHLILTQGLLPPDYSSETSPKVPIYWREEDEEERNTAWELDRVLHAAAVYTHLTPWRNRLIRDGVLSSNDKRLTVEALEDALPAAATLIEALEHHASAFTPVGQAFIESLATTFRRSSMEAHRTLRSVRVTTLA